MSLDILHVSPSFYPALAYGGPVASLYELCLAQRRAGLVVRVLTSTAGCESAAGRTATSVSSYGRWVEDFGVPTYYAPVRLPPDIAPSMLPQLVKLCRSTQVVHITGLFSAASVLSLGIAVGLGQRRPAIVLSPRGALLPWALAHGQARKQRFLSALAPLLRRVDGWHVTSDEEAGAVKAFLAKLGVQGGTIQVVAPGSGLTGAPRPPEPERRASCQLLVLGRIHRVKNLELALAALALLRRTVPAASLVIAGPAADGAYAEELRARATALGIGAAVSWAGLVTGAAKQRLLAESAMLWLCSHMESFGNVVVEALAAGTPVVATRTTPWEILEPAGVGHWVAPQAEDLVSASRELLARQQDAGDRQALAARCRQLVQARFGWEQAERQMRQLYQAALNHLNRPRQTSRRGSPALRPPLV